MPDAGREKDEEGDTDKENERKGRERKRERESFLVAFMQLSPSQISDSRDILLVGDISEQKFVARH